ncbi:thiol:disulfide interchange protein DsbG [Piscirickettsia salmonis]|uniref:thiol:disulfide interchange protein DsbG n=1 Tax=Piscirickettsia salmonis TaxID=1238 RepID=UPI003A81380A
MKQVFSLVITAVIGIGVGAAVMHATDTNNRAIEKTEIEKPQSTIAAASSVMAKDLVMKITQNQFDVSNEFDAGFNIKGFVIKPKHEGQPLVIYANDSGQFAFFGTLFDQDANNLTASYVNKNIQPKVVSKLLQEAAKTHWFLEGKEDAPHQIYLVAEPNCSICHMLYKNLQPYIQRGQLSIRWIMVAFLKQNSEGKAAAILSAKNPVALLEQDEKTFDLKTESGGIVPLAENDISVAVKMALKKNMAFFEKNGMQGTPVVIYKNKQGESQVLPGYPREKLEAFVDNIGKLPVKNNKA